MNTIRLMLVEQVRVVREMLQSVFNEQPDIHVVAKVHESKAALIRARELDPDVILMGILYREDEALRLVRQLRAIAPRSQLVIMDFRPAEAGAAEMIQAGAHGFVLPDTPIENMLHMVRLVSAQCSPIAAVPVPPKPAMVDGDARGPLAAFAGAFLFEGTASSHLTRREEEVANFICAGRSNKEIANELHVSLYTVKTHVRRILEKLALHSRLQIAAYAYRGLPSHNGGHVAPQE